MKKMADRKILPFISLPAILIAAFLSGCNPAPQTQAITPENLQGSWKVNGSPDEYQTVLFLEEQEFKIDRDGDHAVDILGYYSLDGKRIIFKDYGGRVIPACHRGGIYVPQLRGNQLSFELASDECSGRLTAMKRIWQKTTF